MEPDLRASIEAQILKKKPPKLKTVARTLSLAIDNYTPGGSGIVMDPSMMLEENILPPIMPAPHSVPPLDSKKTTIFYVGGGAAGGSGGAIPSNFPEYHTHHSHIAHVEAPTRKQNMRRSDTLEVYAGEMFEMRKTNSFNTQEAMAEDALMSASRRTNSMRNTAAIGYQQDLDIIENKPLSPLQPHAVEQQSNNRRNCRMHKSLYDPHRRHEHAKKEQSLEAIKCHSVGDDDDGINGGGAKRKLSPKFNSAGASLENEVFHTRNNSRSKIEVVDASASTGDVIEVSTMPKKGPHKQHSSHSLDKAHSFRRIARATQSFYLNPNSYDELRLQRGVVGGGSVPNATGKKMHSASMRAKPFRETLTEAKKSKSFVADPFGEYELSPHRRDSKIFVTGDLAEIKKSPRLSANVHADGSGARIAYDHRKTSDFDPTGLDYDAIMRVYRQNRRKSSVTSAGKKKSNKKNSIDDDGEGDSESTRKRKRIVCIIVTVFFSLVLASVFVVVFTLTHSTVSQVQNQTKKVYTFSRDMPLHYNGKIYILRS